MKIKRQKYLMDVVVIRVILIFLLVFYHAFAIYSGAWSNPFPTCKINAVDVPLYSFMAKLSHNFQLEAMTFISGLLLGYSIKRHSGLITFQGCIAKKAKRVLLPCFFFSVFYYVMFFDLSAPWYHVLYDILQGCGHLWYLPMIFWCFVGVYLWEKYVRISPQVLWGLAVCAALLSLKIYLPLRLGYTATFFIYFLSGYFIMKYDLSQRIIWGTKGSILLIVLYVFLGVCLKEIVINWETHSISLKICRVLAMNALHLLGAMMMILALYSLSNRAIVLDYLHNHSRIITLSGYCYGVYIFQQFVLKYLYYKTDFPIIFSSVTLPWISFLLALFLSILFCHLMLKTRFGRFLIG